MTKKKKGIIIALVAVIVVAAVGVGLYFGIGPGAKNASTDNIAVEDGELYRTPVETFWAGVGKAYISFQHKEEPVNKAADDSAVYGDVFQIMVSSEGDFDPWLTGNFNLDEAAGTLMMKAQWDAADENATKLSDADSGEEKIYNSENGEYKISADLPGSATVVFTLNPQRDKVGNAVEVKTDTAANEDKTSENEQQVQQGDIKLTGQTETSGVSCLGTMLIKIDNSWKLQLNVYNMGYQDGLWGTWSKNDDGSLALKVTGSHEQLSNFDNSIKVNYNKDTQEYSATVKFTSSGFTFTLPLNGKAGANTSESTSDKKNNSNKKDDKKSSTVKGEYRVNMNENGIYSNTVGTSYISFMPDGTFKIMVKANGDLYDPWIEGTWKVDGNKLIIYNKEKNDAGISGVKNGSITYTAKDGKVTVNAHFPSGGTASYTVDINVLSGKSDAPAPNPSKPNDKKPDNDNKPNNNPQDAKQGDIKLTGQTETLGVPCLGDMLIKTDKTWKLQLNVYNMGYMDGLWGTWKKNSDGSLSLKVTGKNEQLSGYDNTVKVNYNSKTKEYSTTVKFTSAGFSFSLPLNGKDTGSVSEPEKTIAVTGVSLDKQALELAVGKTADLKATITPSNATNKNINWSSADESRATINNGTVTAKAAGTTYVIAATKDGGFTATCRVTVTEPSADEEYLVATTSEKWFGAYEMSVIFDNGTFYWHGQEGSPADDSWFKGTYSFNSEKTELSLTVSYNANGPHLEAAESKGTDTVTLKADNGKFTIIIKDPSAASINGTFILNVGTSTEKPDPIDPPKPEAKFQLELTASDSIELGGTVYPCNAKLDLYDNNTFKMLVDAGNGETEAASGTWAMDAAYNIVLTVENQAVANSLPDSITLNVDYATMQYSGTVQFAPSQYTVYTLNFGIKSEDPEPEPQPNLQLELTASDSIELGGTAYPCNAKLDLYDNNTFKMLVDAGNGETEAASGTWAMDSAYNIVLTVENQAVVNSLPDSITLNVDYTTYAYSGTVPFNASAYTQYTLNFK